MRFFVAFLLCLALIAPSFAAIWSSCGSASDFLQITDVVINPAVPAKGDLVTVYAAGTLTETVTGGNAKLLVKYGFITLINKNEAICSSEDPLSCPIAAGPYTHSINATIPSDSPSGKYSANVVLTDQNNAEIACINVNIDL